VPAIEAGDEPLPGELSRGELGKRPQREGLGPAGGRLVVSAPGPAERSGGEGRDGEDGEDA
jgi:hypothetical protein